MLTRKVFVALALAAAALVPSARAAAPDLAVTLFVAQSLAAPSDHPWAYITLRNNGGAPADQTAVTFELPSSSSAYSFDAACTGTTTKVCNGGTIAAGAERTLIFELTLPQTPGTYTYHASATTTGESNPADNSASTNMTVSTNADLQVTSSASPSSVHAGDQIVFTNIVHNLGPATANSATLTDVLPEGSHIYNISVDHQYGNCVSSQNEVHCTLNGLTGYDIRVSIQIAAPLANGTYTNNVTVSASNDANTSNNSSSTSFTVFGAAEAGLSVQVAGPPAFKQGGDFTSTITVHNGGPSPAANVAVTATLANASPRGISGAGFSCATTPVMRCTMPLLAANANATVTLAGSVPATAPLNAAVQITGFVSSDTADPDPNDNFGGFDGVVSARVIDLHVEAGAPPTTLPLHELTYHVVLQNRGTDDSSHVVLTLTVPKGFEIPLFRPALPQCTELHQEADSSTLVCRASKLAPGAELVLDILAKAPAADGRYQATFAVTSDGPEATPDDDSVVVTTVVASGRRRSTGR